MSLPVFIGHEVDAAGYHLAGLQVRSPAEDQLLDAIQWARDHAPLVLISADLAQHLPGSVLDRLLAGVTPPVVIVPSIHTTTPMPDLETRIRQQLGVLE